jgi:GMP reductase
MYNKLLRYEDVCLIPRFGMVETRKACDTSTNFLGFDFNLPIMPANMKAVINEEWCEFLSENKYFYCMHRFDIDIQKFIEECNRKNLRLISASFGVKHQDKAIIDNLHSSGARLDVATIDVAHGHCQSVKEILEYFKKNLPETKLIAGNVATPQAVRDLHSWGADAIKVGIGQGSPCTTKNKTGFTMPMFSCVKECSNQYHGSDIFDDCGSNLDASKKIPIIADGGLSHNGDIAKALVAGADFVMAGSMFASCVDSPAVSINVDGTLHKAYFGSASFENKRHNNNIEGMLKKLSSNGMTLEEKLYEIKQDLQSSISYGGGKELSALTSVEYRELS